MDAATKAAQEPVASQPLPQEGPRTGVPQAGGGPDVLICSDHPLQAPATAAGADGTGRLSSPCSSFGGSARSGAELEAAAAAAAADTAPEAPVPPLHHPAAAVDISEATNCQWVTSGTANASHTVEASAKLKRATGRNALDEQLTALSSEMDSTEDGRSQVSVSTTAQPLPDAFASAEAAESIHVVDSRQPSETDESAADGGQAPPLSEPLLPDTTEQAEEQLLTDTPAADAPARPLGEGQASIPPESREELPVQEHTAAAGQPDPAIPLHEPQEQGTNCMSTEDNPVTACDDMALSAAAEDATNDIAYEPAEGDGLPADEALDSVPAEMLDSVPADLAGSGLGITDASMDAGTAGGLMSESYPAIAASHESDRNVGEEVPVDLSETHLQSSVDVQLADTAPVAVGIDSSGENERSPADHVGADLVAATESQSTGLERAESAVIDLGREQPTQGFDHEQPLALGENLLGVPFACGNAEAD